MNDFIRIPIGDVANTAIRWIIDVFGWFFDGVYVVFRSSYDALSWVLNAPPFWILVILIAALAFWAKGLWLAIGAAAGLLVIAGVNQWGNAMDTLALVLIAALVAIAISIPIGIWAARNDHVSAVIRPILDFLQTMPAFVYLVPAILVFSAGPVPGIVATIFFSLAPGVRLTELGIRGVDKEVVEAGNAFGATPGRILRQIQLPLALPSIMAGVNQIIMLSLSMVVIAGLVGAGALGNQIVQSLSRLDVALGVEAGISVVILAIILDRLTSGLAASGGPRARRRAGKREETGPTRVDPAVAGAS